MRASAHPLTTARASRHREGNKMNTRHTAAVTVLLAAAVVPAANADIIYVGPGDSIQRAIDAAMDGDEIVVALLES